MNVLALNIQISALLATFPLIFQLAFPPNQSNWALLCFVAVTSCIEILSTS